jgi:hypothetical protein
MATAKSKALKKSSFGCKLSNMMKVPTQQELDTYGYNRKIKNQISLKNKLNNRI